MCTDTNANQKHNKTTESTNVTVNIATQYFKEISANKLQNNIIEQTDHGIQPKDASLV